MAAPKRRSILEPAAERTTGAVAAMEPLDQTLAISGIESGLGCRALFARARDPSGM